MFREREREVVSREREVVSRERERGRGRERKREEERERGNEFSNYGITISMVLSYSSYFIGKFALNRSALIPALFSIKYDMNEERRYAIIVQRAMLIPNHTNGLHAANTPYINIHTSV